MLKLQSRPYRFTGKLINNEFKKVWKEAAVNCLIARNFPGRAVENHKKAQPEELVFVQDLNRDLPYTK
jgi:hypothetical protein